MLMITVIGFLNLCAKTIRNEMRIILLILTAVIILIKLNRLEMPFNMVLSDITFICGPVLNLLAPILETVTLQG